MKYDNDDEFHEHERYGFHLRLDSEMPLCTAGDEDNVITLGDLEDGESCAQLIRDRCSEIGHDPLEY